MPSTTDRMEFLPPAPPGMLRAFGLAILAHLFLLGALTWGVNWKRLQSDTITAEAELWSSVPQQAAPKAQEPPPAPPPVPEAIAPKVIAPPPPAPEVQPEPQTSKVDIALEKEKEKKKQLAKELEEERQQDKEAKLQEDKAKKAADKKTQELAAQKKAADEAKKAALKKAQDDAQRAAAAAAQAEQDAKASAEQREANLRRIAGLAGASGGATATGSAQQSSGWSNSYGGRVKARVKPNLVFTSATSGNPMVSLEIKLAPDGTILGRPKVLKSSGNSEWDEAVVRAFEKTEILPKDVDGQVR
ncbi:MAG: cell envelope integrity protein TolA, partial [Burkholderiaceae bacterium]